MTKIRAFAFAALALLAIGGAAAFAGEACAQGRTCQTSCYGTGSMRTCTTYCY